MSSRAARKTLRWILWLSLALLVLIVAALLVAPRLLNLPAVQAKLERQLSEAANGHFEWAALDVRLLPTPRGTLRAARIDIPETVSGRVDAVEIRLRLWALLTARVEVQEVRIVRPVLSVVVPEPQGRDAAAPADPFIAYREAMQPFVDAVRRFAPDVAFTVHDATLDVSIPGLPDIGQVNLMVEGRSDRRHMALTATATGKLWERLQAKARVDYADLKAHAEIDGAGLKPQLLLDHFLSGAVVALSVPSGNVHAELDTDGASAFNARLTTDIPALTVMRNHSRIELFSTHAEGSAVVRGQAMELTLVALRVGDLVPRASARVHFGGTQDGAEASLEVPALDLARARSVMTTLAGDVPAVERYVSRLRSGQATELRMSARAQTLAGLLDPAAINASLKLTSGAMLVPEVEQEVTDVSAAIAWNDGVLRLRGATGRMGQTRVTDGAFDYRPDSGDMRVGTEYDIDVTQALDLARRLVPQAQRSALDVVRAARGKAAGRLALALERDDWKLDVALTRSDASLSLRGLPWPATLHGAQITLTPKRAAIAQASGTVGASTFRGVGIGLSTDGPPRIDSASGFASLALAECYVWLREQEALADALRPITSVTGSLDVKVDRLSGSLQKLDALEYEVTVRPHQVHLRSKELPAPASFDGGSMTITSQALRVDAVMHTLLDFRARVSGAVHGWRGQGRKLEASVADGESGPELVTWIWKRSSLPPNLRPRTPLRFAVQRLLWNAKDGLDIRASAQIVDGPSVHAEGAWKPAALDVRAVHVKDQESDATLSLRLRSRLVHAGFSGRLTGRSAAGLFAQGLREEPGRIEGDFRAIIDRDMRGRSQLQGRVTGRQIPLDRLLQRPLTVERIDLQSDGATLRVNEASLDYMGQKATIRGEVGRGATGLVIDARIETPGIVVDTLLPESHKIEAHASAAHRQKTPEAQSIWPLPVEGTVALHAGFIEYRRYRIEPVVATLRIEPERVHVQATQAMLCGMAFPFTAELTPQAISTGVHIQIKEQPLDTTVRCLSGERALLTGRLDLRADLYTSGKTSELLRNLEGSVVLHARGGKVMKAPLIGNILSMKSISALLKGEVKLDAKGFDYRTIDLRGRIAGGRFQVEQGAFDSPAVGLAATGSVRLHDREAELMVLVAPFSRINRLTRSIPVLGYILGGALTSVAVGVSGDIRDPVVLPLDPRAVTSELAGIFERTLKLPAKLLKPFEGAAHPAPP